MQQKLEPEIPKHLKLLIDELDKKNITGVQLIKQGSKIMLLFDKTLLSKTNQTILNTINAVYPNIIISINDSKNPFDYTELYALDSEKSNRKVRPHTVWSYRFEHPKQNGTADKYFQKFRFAGIELDTNVASDRKIQFGYFLEFINALQVQDVIGYEDLDVLDTDTIRRHQHYIDSGSPDTTRNIEVSVKYNERLEEYSNDLKIADDPYLPKLCIADINVGATNVHKVHVQLTLSRIIQNVQEYFRRKLQGNGDEPKTKNTGKHHNKSQYELEI